MIDLIVNNGRISALCIEPVHFNGICTAWEMIRVSDVVEVEVVKCGIIPAQFCRATNREFIHRMPSSESYPDNPVQYYADR